MNLVPCPACGNSLSPKASTCPKCGHPITQNEIPAIFPHFQYGYGFNYRSKINILGLPLIHIASGFDPETRQKRIAKGVIAIGDIALGVFALGGLSLGIFTLGGLALGALALGGLAIGGIAVGGAAIGYIAVGGAAVGYYAIGGAAFGKHTLGPLGQDPELLKLLTEKFGIDLSSFIRR